MFVLALPPTSMGPRGINISIQPPLLLYCAVTSCCFTVEIAFECAAVALLSSACILILLCCYVYTMIAPLLQHITIDDGTLASAARHWNVDESRMVKQDELFFFVEKL